MTLKQVKDEVARNHGWPNWDEFIGDPEICFAEDRDLVSIVTDEIAKRYAKAKLEEAADRAIIAHSNNRKDGNIDIVQQVAVLESITETPLD